MAASIPPANGALSARERQRGRILDALFAVISSSGVGGASVTEIAEAAGIARGALHYYFESKEELFGALMTRLGDGYHERAMAFLDREIARGRADTLVESLTRWHFAGDAEHAERLMSVWIDFWGQAPTRPAIGGVVFAVQERARALCLRALLVQRPELSAADAGVQRIWSATLLAIIEGGLLQWRVAARAATPLDRTVLGDALASAAARTTSSFFMPEVR
jgi:AcrR family transcriptional regulator